MLSWKRQAPNAPEDSAVADVVPERKILAELIPERDEEGNFYWQPFVDRMTQRFEGLPDPDGSDSFVRACLAAGCEAVPLIHRNRSWRKRQPAAWDEKARAAFELRIRLGLFFAASARHLVHGICRLRIKTGDLDWHPWKGSLQAGEVRWHPVMGATVAFREFLSLCEAEPEITWLEAKPNVGQVCAVVPRFFQAHELRVLTLELLTEVMECVQPGAPGGLFGHMLFAAGQIEEEEEETVDVAAAFLEAIRQAIKRKRLQVNCNPGDVFVTSEVSFLVAPKAVDRVIGFLRKKGPSFGRKEVYRALGTAGYLEGIGPEADQHTPWATVASPDWRGPIHVRGLPIAHSALWASQAPPSFFDGTVTIQS